MRSDWEEIERHHQPLLSPREIFGAIVIVGLIAMLIGASRPVVATREPGVAEDHNVQGAGSPSDTTILQGIPTEITLPAASPNRDPAGQGSYVRFYECVVAGQRVLSDNPCGVDAKARTLVVPQPDPAEVARLLQHQQQQQWQAQQQQRARPVITPPSVASTNAGAGYAGDGTPANQAACDNVDRQIELLNARMRQGYGSAEGEWYRSEWHALKTQRHELRCGR